MPFLPSIPTLSPVTLASAKRTQLAFEQVATALRTNPRLRVMMEHAKHYEQVAVAFRAAETGVNAKGKGN